MGVRGRVTTRGIVMTDHSRESDATTRGRRRLLALALTGALVLAQLLLGAVSPAGACACGAFIDPADERTGANVLEETAVLALSGGTQTVVMGLELDAERTGSTLLMPTPTVPEVSAAEAGTLREIQAATAPREEVELDLWGTNPFAGPEAGADGGAPTGAPEVTVHEQSRVGDYEVAVLGGEADGVRDWLGENGYELPEPVSALLDPYAEEGWTFTAIRYAEDAELSGEVEPLRFDFASEELIYPVRFSQAAESEQTLHLFVLGEEPMRRTDASAAHQEVERPWIADPTVHDWVWTDATLRELTGTELAEHGASPNGERFPGVVTEFEIRGEPESFTTDLVFAEDPDAEWVVPTETVTHTVTVAGIPVGWLLVAAGVITVLALGVAASALAAALRMRRRAGLSRGASGPGAPLTLP